MPVSEQLLQDVERHVTDFFLQNVSDKYVFHDLEHTVQTVAAAKVIAEGFNFTEQELQLLQLATWFHDTGYTDGPVGHEERSYAHAENFLRPHLSHEELEVIKGCILATKVPQKPRTTLERVLCDADLSHLGMRTYWDRTSKFRQELILTRQLIMSDRDWVDFEIDFMLSHNYHTEVANELFNKRKAKHVQQLLKQKRRLNPDKAPTTDEIALLSDEDKKTDIQKVLNEREAELKLSRFGRGVETMYRTTYRTHTNLSAMADNKANLMLSVNAIVISIMVSNLLPRLHDAVSLRMLIPTALLTGTCLGSMVFATLATRPKVTEGKVTREAIQERKANLLFFGNFHNMKLDDFQWGVNEMLKDPSFLYSSMSRDLYFLGIVLAKKYRYLSICYNIFMYGLIISVAAFILAFAI
ncbi:MAG: Pycsar system effector family protein [Saprospiraceae bacterium]